MLEALQSRLSAIYRVGDGYDVRDFLITDRAVATALGPSVMHDGTDETLLLAEQGDELALSLFLDGALLERLEASDPLVALCASDLDDLWKVVEGVSHFNCVIWKAREGRSVSLLELELQAEVDKFVSTAQLAVEQGNPSLLRNLHRWLFDDVRFRDGLCPDELDRYRSANDFAARFCHRLSGNATALDAAAVAELRHFFRLPIGEKISHIRAGAFRTSAN